MRERNNPYEQNGYNRSRQVQPGQNRQGQNLQRQNPERQNSQRQNPQRQNAQRQNSQRQNPQRQNPYDDYQRQSRRRKKKKHTVGKVIAIIQAILSVIVLDVLFVLGVLPMMYLAGIAVLLIILWLFSFFSQFTRKSHVVGKVYSVILCCILGFVAYYLLITQNMLSRITNYTYNVDNMVVAVMNTDPAQSLQDAADYSFGVRLAYDGELAEHAIERVNQIVDKKINVVEYDSLTSQIEALYNGEVRAIIYNDNMLGSIEETHPFFTSETRILESVSIKTNEVVDEVKDISVTEDPFLIYISGNDGYGQLSIKGRSDVNMLVAINPKTKQILMLNTPRDYWVVFPNVTGGVNDKLTHAGNYGMQCSMDTLESIYGRDINYYVRVNFSSLINMVDALGGVTVMSDFDFDSHSFHFNKGANDIKGEQALAFARERYSFADGDFQRGRNQQLLLTAMIKKAMSPAILTGYSGIMASVQNNFATNMSEGNITSLVKMQLEKGGEWNFVTIGASGTTSTQYCYSLGGNASVVIPDQVSVDACKVMLDKLFNGEILESPAAQ